MEREGVSARGVWLQDCCHSSQAVGHGLSLFPGRICCLRGCGCIYRRTVAVVRKNRLREAANGVCARLRPILRRAVMRIADLIAATPGIVLGLHD